MNNQTRQKPIALFFTERVNWIGSLENIQEGGKKGEVDRSFIHQLHSLTWDKVGIFALYCLPFSCENIGRFQANILQRYFLLLPFLSPWFFSVQLAIMN